MYLQTASGQSLAPVTATFIRVKLRAPVLQPKGIENPMSTLEDLTKPQNIRIMERTITERSPKGHHMYMVVERIGNSLSTLTLITVNLNVEFL